MLPTVEIKMPINKHDSFDPGLPRLVAHESNSPFVALQELQPRHTEGSGTEWQLMAKSLKLSVQVCCMT